VALIGSAAPAFAAPTGSSASYMMASPLAVGVETGTDYTQVSCPLVTVELKIEPHGLNLKAKGEQFVTAYVKVPTGFLASQIDISSLLLNNVVPVSLLYAPKITDHDSKLKVKFLRSLLIPTLTAGHNVPVTITGLISGLCFAGTDFIKVSAPKVHHPAPNDNIVAGTNTQVAWDFDPAAPAQVKLEASLNGGTTWVTQAEGLANSGSYSWHVPSTYASSQSLLRVLIVYEVDENGEVPDVETAYSDQFEILGGTTGVDGSVAEFSLRGALPSPSVDRLSVSFSLKNSKPATLALFDLGGRMIETQRVDQLGPGSHIVTFAQRNLSAGVYLIRLTQDGKSLNARTAFVR
jgi:hypothetical protein